LDFAGVPPQERVDAEMKPSPAKDPPDEKKDEEMKVDNADKKEGEEEDKPSEDNFQNQS
jgi:hypothetical protein